MWIWEKHNTNESSTDRRSRCLHDRLDLCWGELASRDSNEELEEQEIQCYKAEAAIEPQINTKTFIDIFICFYWLLCTKGSLTNNFRYAEQILSVKTSPPTPFLPPSLLL